MLDETARPMDDIPSVFPSGTQQPGMTLMDYFAAQVLNGLVSHFGFNLDESSSTEFAWHFAATMVRTRPTNPEQEWSVVIE